MMRPRHSGPTGMVIGAPVSITWSVRAVQRERCRTLAPRTRPSVPVQISRVPHRFDAPSMAIVRTVFSPRCCAHSRTRRPPRSPGPRGPAPISPAGTRRARTFRIGGRFSPSNWTSTTAPMTVLTEPTCGGQRHAGRATTGLALGLGRIRAARGCGACVSARGSGSTRVAPCLAGARLCNRDVDAAGAVAGTMRAAVAVERKRAFARAVFTAARALRVVSTAPDALGRARRTSAWRTSAS